MKGKQVPKEWVAAALFSLAPYLSKKLLADAVTIASAIRRKRLSPRVFDDLLPVERGEQTLAVAKALGVEYVLSVGTSHRNVDASGAAIAAVDTLTYASSVLTSAAKEKANHAALSDF